MDYSFYPHLFDAILTAAASDYAFSPFTSKWEQEPGVHYQDYSTPLGLRGTCRAVRDRFDVYLAKHICWDDHADNDHYSTPNGRRLPSTPRLHISYGTPTTHNLTYDDELRRFAQHTQILDLYEDFFEEDNVAPIFPNLEVARADCECWFSVTASTLLQRVREPYNANEFPVQVNCPVGLRRLVARVPIFGVRSNTGFLPWDMEDVSDLNEVEFQNLPDSLEEVVVLVDWSPSKRAHYPWPVATPEELAAEDGYPGVVHSVFVAISPVLRLFGLNPDKTLVEFAERGGSVTFVDPVLDTWEAGQRAEARQALLAVAELPLESEGNVQLISWEEWRETATDLQLDWLDRNSEVPHDCDTPRCPAKSPGGDDVVE